ncbi:MAG TPA: Ig-like domain-containing protein [Gemmatimonadaceae bacterium]|nr:Ig-like domain-containing protein [Gemmatimonadaceae bacterium]
MKRVLLGLSMAAASLYVGCETSRLTDGGEPGDVVATVTVTPAADTIAVNETVQLGATPRNESGTPLSTQVEWTSNNSQVASVSSSGLVTAHQAGTATITAASGGKSAQASILVVTAPPPPPAAVASVTVTPATASVDSGKTVQLTATLRDANGATLTGRAVTWTSLNPGVATVSSSGLVTGVKSGTANVYALSEGKSDTATITVVTPPPPPPPAPVASVTVTPTSVTVETSRTAQLTATLRDANGTTLTGRTVTWTSVNPSIATVSGTGLVTGVAPGTAQVYAASEGKSDTTTITVVRPPVASVTLTPASATVETGKTVQLTATLRDQSGTTLTGRQVTWTSLNPAVATVSNDGLVTGVAVGTANVYALSEGKSDTSTITVVAPPPPGASVVFVGAGDIGDCGRDAKEQTARLLDAIPGTVYTTGDNAYPDGTDADFANCYHDSWGRHRDRTRPTPGNHDYHTTGAAPYYRYFGENAGPAGRGYYSFDLGEWHIIALNSNVSMSATSEQVTWLKADLAANTKRCTLAYWHHPRFSSGNHGNATSTQPLWDALYAADADVILAGHDHNYERFAPQTPTGAADAVRGIREFVIGTGGRSFYNFGTIKANSEVRNNNTWGVLKLTLHADRYDWEFVPVAGKTFTDTGTGMCH